MPATVFPIIKWLILKCIMAVVCIRLKNVFDVTEKGIKSLFKYYVRFIC